MSRHVVARVEEVPPGSRKLLEIDRRAIALFNVNGEFFALRNRCPHQGAALGDGKLTGLVESPEPGHYQYSRPGEMLRCPWHGWEFDIRTGKSWCDPRRTRVMAYSVSVEKGSKLVEGPYVAEVFPVTVEGEYVIVEA